MMEFYVSGQSLKMFTPVTAADSLKYLTAQFHFTDNEWDSYTRWAHFRRGETVYDIELDENDRITEEDALNLTTGEWEIYLTGTKDTARLTTVVVVLTVKESGLVDAPLHVLPQSFEIKGYYASTAALEEGVPAPAPGDAYCVGSAAPYDVYIYDGVSGEWINNGTIQGAKGDTGAAGTTFTPHVDGNGNLSWTNDGGLDNPTTQSIRGDTGAKGETGAAGKSAYAAAVEAGYTGTEATFYAALTAMPYHNARHLPDGADPITVKAGNLEASAVETAKIKDKAVTMAKLADHAVSVDYTVTLNTTWSGSAAPYTKEQTINGILATDKPLIDLVPSATFADAEKQTNAWALVYRAVTAANKITFYAKAKPTVSIPLQIRCIRK